MTVTGTVLDIPARLRPTVAEGYRELAAGNRMLYAETGTLRFLELAEYAEGKVAELAYGGSVTLGEAP